MTTLVPPDYIGLWRRKGIWRSDGTSDLTTQAWWFQSSLFHIDLRIPADRPMVANAVALAHLAPVSFARFAAQTGFAGLTVVHGTRCEWQPEIALPAISADLDAGWMRFDAADQLHESGLDDSYQEDWIRVTAGPVIGVRFEAASSDAAPNSVAYLVIGDAWLAFAHGAPSDAFPSCPPSTGVPPWSEFCIARHDPGSGAWRVLAANRPWHEGAILFAHSAMSLERARQFQLGDLVILPTGIETEWRIAGIAPIIS